MSSCVSLGMDGLPELEPERLDTSRNHRSDGRRTASKDRRDRILGQILVVAEHDRRALSLRQSSEGVHDDPAIDHRAFRTGHGLRRGRAREEPPFNGSATETVLRQVDHGAAEVRIERARVPQMTEVPDDSDERILRDVFRDGLIPGQQEGESDGSRVRIVRRDRRACSTLPRHP